MESTSVSLIQRLGQQPADSDWERFHALYRPLLMFWGQQRLGLQKDEAEDLVQDVLIHLMAKLQEFEYQPDKTFRGWLRMVCLNKGRDSLRKKGRHPDALESGELRNLDMEGDIGFLTEQEYNAAIARQALNLMKEEFQETTWKACWLHVVDGLPANEISEQLGISGNAVYLAKARVLKRLREELNGLWVA